MDKTCYILTGGCPDQFVKDYNLIPEQVKIVEDYAEKYNDALLIGQVVDGTLEVVHIKNPNRPPGRK